MEHGAPDPGDEVTKAEEGVPEAAENSSAHRVTFLGPETQDVEVTHKKLGKLTVKYNRKELQRRIKLEEWIDNQIEALYLSQDGLRDEAAELEIDIDDLLDMSVEEQKTQLEEMLQESPRPTQEFVAELLERIQGLRKIETLQRK